MDFFFQGLVTYGRIESFFTMIFFLFFGIVFIIFGGWLLFNKFEPTTGTVLSNKYNIKSGMYDLIVSYIVNNKTYTTNISSDTIRDDNIIILYYSRRNPKVISTSNLNNSYYVYLSLIIGLLFCFFGISDFYLSQTNRYYSASQAVFN